MDQVLVHPPFVPTAPAIEIDERAARETLRGQISRLERELVEALADARPGEIPPGARRLRGPRILSLGELEHVRDDLAERLAAARRAAAARAEAQAEQRVLLERMLREPARYKWVRVMAADLGEGGCIAYHVKPRLGLVGMLAGWWHVKVSSGCPLASGHPWSGRLVPTSYGALPLASGHPWGGRLVPTNYGALP